MLVELTCWVLAVLFFVLLKCMVARWLLDVSFQVIFRMTLTCTLDMNGQDLSFGRPAASALAPWKPIGGSRGT